MAVLKFCTFAHAPKNRAGPLALLRVSQTVKRHPELPPRIASRSDVTRRNAGNRRLLASCRPGGDGRRHFDRDHRFRSVDQQLRSSGAPGPHEALEGAKLPVAEDRWCAIAKAIDNSHGCEVRLGRKPCLDAGDIGLQHRRSTRYRLAPHVRSAVDGPPLACLPCLAKPFREACDSHLLGGRDRGAGASVNAVAQLRLGFTHLRQQCDRIQIAM